MTRVERNAERRRRVSGTVGRRGIWSTFVNRRRFLKTTGMGTAALGMAGLGGFAHAIGGSITLDGADYPHPDAAVAAVQEALDTNTEVTLVGVFDFRGSSDTDFISITNPGTILRGPGTIISDVWYGIAAIEVYVPGVKVLDLTVNSGWNGILVRKVVSGSETIELKGNTVSAYLYGILCSSWGVLCPLEIEGNSISGSTAILGHYLSDRVDIHNNEMSTLGDFGLWVSSWYTGGLTNPEGGENEPVHITGNTLHIDNISATAFFVGTSAHGINNCYVAGNTLTGSSMVGIEKSAFGHDNIFRDNDLSGLTTHGPQIWLYGGGNNQFLNNRLGPVVPGEWGYGVLEGGMLFAKAPAILSTTIDWHSWEWDVPLPVNEGNVFAQNDLRLTGLPGWSDEGTGCILLMDQLIHDSFVAGREPSEWLFWYELYATYNKVHQQGRYPKGTTMCDQVLDMSAFDADNKMTPITNTIVGWKACEAHNKKDYLASGTFGHFQRNAREIRRSGIHPGRSSLQT